jgi:hypothetical protein
MTHQLLFIGLELTLLQTPMTCKKHTKLMIYTCFTIYLRHQVGVQRKLQD